MNKNVKISKRELIREKRRKGEQRQRIFLIGVVIVIGLIIAGILIYPSLQPPVSVIKSTPYPSLNPQGLAQGDPNAPVKVQEFGDFQCPGCKNFFINQEASFITDYVLTGKVYFSFVPLSFLGTESENATQAAYCASDQGKFWEYHDMLYTNQGQERSGAFSDNKLIAFAQALELNMGDFTSCYTNGKYKQQVTDNNNLGNQDKVLQTPSFMVNGKLVSVVDLLTTVDADLTANQAASPTP